MSDQQAGVPDLGTIGKYQLVELVGEGAMGKVYRAQDPILARMVAIKLMSASISTDVHLRDRFLREARAAANLQHPNVITIYDFGDAGGHPYIAMEFVDGTDLARIIQEREPLSLDTKVGHVIGLLNGLAYAHAKGVVHRDIKPANVRITPDGRAKIMDFGIAHLAGSEMTHSGVVLGTPDYMAPEQVRGLPVTPQTDIFAAGAVLYELLTYEKPFGGETLHAVLFKVVTEDPVPIQRLNPSLPEALERIVSTALNKDPGKRYPTADAMAADLMAVRKHLTELETRATLRFSRPLLATELLPWYRRRPAMVFGAGASGLVAVLLAVVLASGGEPVTPVVAQAIIVSDTAPVVAPADSLPPPAAGQETPGVARQPPAPAPRQAGAATPEPARAAAANSGSRTAPGVRPADDSEEADRTAISEAILLLERAYASASVPQIRRYLPNMSAPIADAWDGYFKGKQAFDARFEVEKIELRDSVATAQIKAGFSHLVKGERRTTVMPLTGVLVKQRGAWSWRSLDQ